TEYFPFLALLSYHDAAFHQHASRRFLPSLLQFYQISAPFSPFLEKLILPSGICIYFLYRQTETVSFHPTSRKKIRRKNVIYLFTFMRQRLFLLYKKNSLF